MNFSHFIAQRLAFAKSKSFSKIIVRIAIASVAISLATMIVSSAILDGFKKEISGKVYSFWGHIHITDTSINSTLQQRPISKSTTEVSELREVEEIEYKQRRSILGYPVGDDLVDEQSKGGIRHIQNFVMAPGLLRTKEEFGAIMLKGVDETFDWEYVRDMIKEGTPLSQGDTKIPEIVVSKVTAAQLELKVGQRLVISTIKNNREWKKRFVVAGIYSTGLEEYDSRIAFVAMSAAQDILGWTGDEVSGMEVFLEDASDMDLYNEYIYEELPSGLYSESIHVKYASIFEWLKLQDINMVVILVLMIIVSVINMITFLLIFIVERSQMVGLLMSVGASNWDIRKVFVYTGAYVIGFGLILGNLLGLAICFAQQYFKLIKLDEASYYLAYAPVSISWSTVLWLNILCFVVTVLALLIPSYLVSRLSPIKVLRFG